MQDGKKYNEIQFRKTKIYFNNQNIKKSSSPREGNKKKITFNIVLH